MGAGRIYYWYSPALTQKPTSAVLFYRRHTKEQLLNVFNCLYTCKHVSDPAQTGLARHQFVRLRLWGRRCLLFHVSSCIECNNAHAAICKGNMKVQW